MSINLSEPVLAWANQQAAIRGFATVEEYLETLLLRERYGANPELVVQEVAAREGEDPSSVSPARAEMAKRRLDELLTEGQRAGHPDDPRRLGGTSPQSGEPVGRSWLMAKISRRPAAELDLEDIAVHIGRNSRSVAFRFLDAADRTFEVLAARPRLGGKYVSSNPRLIDLRHFLVRGFRSYVVFYLPREDGIEWFGCCTGRRMCRRSSRKNEPGRQPCQLGIVVLGFR